jgi:sec-independent protein translocase protein TatA
MGGIGVPELAIVLVIIVIIFGVGKLPEIGGALGKGIREFKQESQAEIEEREAREAQERIEAGKSTTASTLTAGQARTEEKVPTSVGSRADEI